MITEVETVRAWSMDGDKRGVVSEAVCPACSVALYEKFDGDYSEYHEVGGKTPWDGTEVCVYVFPDYSVICECGERFTVECNLDGMLDDLADEVDSRCSWRYADEGAYDHPKW